MQNARSWRRYIRRDTLQVCRVLLQFSQLCRGIRAAVDWRFACDSMNQRCAEAVNVAANVLRLVAQSFPGHIWRRPPDHTAALCILRCKGGEAEVANLRRLFIDKQNVGRLHISMNQTLPLSCAKSSRYLNANVEHLIFRQTTLSFDEIVKTSVIDQFHHHIKLAVVHSQREYLHDIGMIHRGSNARLLLQLRSMIRFATNILTQQFERNEPL